MNFSFKVNQNRIFSKFERLKSLDERQKNPFDR